jgi:glycosyltransferase involved in cell wall biosynthesis
MTTASRNARRLQANLAIVRVAERAVREEVRYRRFEIAVTHAELAARFASQRHGGRFASVTLERCLEEVGQATVAGGNATGGKGVLHVSTRAVGMGGHTQWVRRIIEGDTTRCHSVVLTGPERESFPPDLAQAIERSGGKIYRLAATGAKPGGRIERARALRDLALQFDLVMLSTDPADAVPSVAFAPPRHGLPVARLNHADHIFWLGAAVSDVLIEFRPVGARFSVARRGYPAERIETLRLPVDVPATVPRAQARQQLNLSEDAFVVISIGAPYKFEGFQGPGYLDIVRPVLEAIPELTIVAVGPPQAGAWAEAVETFAPRLRLHPPARDLSPFFAASDAFLNPTPIGSDTLLWEAAASGLPIITMRPERPGLELLRCDPAEAQGVALVPEDSLGLAEAIASLLTSPELRAELGARARDLVTRERVGAAWRAHLAEVMTASSQASPMTADQLVACDFSEEVDAYVASWASVGSLRKALVRRVRERAGATRRTRTTDNK